MTETLEQSRLMKINTFLLTGKYYFKMNGRGKWEGGENSIETSMGTGLDKSIRFLF
jgi:hypothetical protein